MKGDCLIGVGDERNVFRECETIVRHAYIFAG